MKSAFIFLLLIHGLIHLMGFIKGFQFAEINQLSQSISKPIGVLWLFATILFIISTLLFILKKEWWFIIAIAAVIISQILIILYWKDAKFGTMANSIILFVSISAYGNYQFNKMVNDETEALFKNIKVESTPIVSENDISYLPKIIQKWIRNSGFIGKERIVSVRLKQKGKMRIKPQSKWLSFKAEQYFNVKQPAFIWSTEVDFLSAIKMIGRDKLINGEGDMLIKLASLFPVANEGENEKINSAAMIRYLAEMTWFPSAALNDYIHWDIIDELTAKATFTIHDKSVLGIFKFSEHGQMTSFEAQRYYGGGKNATLETWLVKTEEYKDFNGFKIPIKCKVVWKLEDRDFNWLNFEIMDWKCNTRELYGSKNL